MTAGERLKIARKNAGLTQRELGEKIGVTSNLINQYESGIRNITHNNALRLAEVCGVSQCWLAHGCEANLTIEKSFYAETEREIQLLQKFRLMNADKQRALLAII